MTTRPQRRPSQHIYIDNKSFERVEHFKYLGTSLMNQNSIYEEIKCRLQSGNACYYLVQNLLSSSLLSKNVKVKIIQNYNFSCCFVWVWNLVSTVSEEHRLRVLRKIFGPTSDKVMGDWGRRHNETLYDLYSPNIWVIKSRKLRWVGHVACMGKRILVGRPEGRRPLERPRHTWWDDIQMDLQEMGWGALTRLIWILTGTGQKFLWMQ